MIKTYISLIAVLYFLTGCKEESKTPNKLDSIELNKNLVSEQDDYLETIDELSKEFFKNYWEIEKMVSHKLEQEGKEYFIENNCYDILSKFESTLEAYCQICENLNVNNTGGLLTSYLHLNDIENVKKQYELMRDEENAFIYKDFHKYEDSGKILESKYVSIKFDARVEEFANAVFEHIDNVEEFLIQKWEGLLPPKIRVILLYSDGPGPYNPDLNETYLPVKSKPLSSSLEVAGYIVHETFHLVNVNILEKNCEFPIENGMNSFKFLDEGSAQIIESKFMNKFDEDRREVDEYARKIVASNSFDVKELKTKWFELFSSPDVSIYKLAYSFAYFLEEKYGEDKYEALFLPKTKISENSWLEYVENYFGSSVDELIDEWKQNLKK